MVIIKTAEQINGIKQSCHQLYQVMVKLREAVKPGVSTQELNTITEDLIQKGGGKPSFKGYKASTGGQAFPTAVCASINNTVVHGPATSQDPLKDGDILGLDVGINLNGYYSDMALTVAIGKVKSEILQLLDVTEKALWGGIKKCLPGNTIRDISLAIQNVVLPYKYGIVKGYAGHGVGLQVHEDPWIPNFVSKQFAKELAIELKPGMIFALEPMITLGSGDVYIDDDGWSVKTQDGSMSAHYEHTILITEQGYEVLTLIE